MRSSPASTRPPCSLTPAAAAITHCEVVDGGLITKAYQLAQSGIHAEFVPEPVLRRRRH